MENQTLDSNETLLGFLYRTPIGIVQTSASGQIEMLNPKSSQLLMPLSPDGNLENLFTVLSVVAPELRHVVINYAHDTGIVCETYRIGLTANQTISYPTKVLSLNILKISNDKLMFVINDVTLEVQKEQDNLDRQINEANLTDNLTRMPNRMAIRENILSILNRSQASDGFSFAVIFINCDRFKQINDAYGNVTGDEVLGLIADRLRLTLRQGDLVTASASPVQIAARVSSDEFVVVLDSVRQVENVAAVALRILDTLNLPYQTTLHQVTCTVSMGIAVPGLNGKNGTDPDTLLQDASFAMAEAKRQGGARFCMFDPIMRDRAEYRSVVEADLRFALVKDELFLVYQPVVSLQGSNDIANAAGVEALVRWQHPSRGVVPPLEFISIAEESGLICALGDFVLTRACSDFIKWRRNFGSSAPSFLAVNVSRAQLVAPQWHLKVRDILETTGMLSNQLQLEVTESLAAQDMVVQQRLKELKALGLTLALDDFGTGYSSLSCVHELPVDIIKIDKSFVDHICTSVHHRVLVEATIKVAHSLDMTTVAEGVETAEQASILSELGCDKGQGYYYSRPLIYEDLTHWIAATEINTSAYDSH